MQGISSPIHSFPVTRELYEKLPSSQKASMRLIHRHGRMGIQVKGLNESFCLRSHNLNEPRGSISCWFLPLFDFHTWQQLDQHKMTHPQADHFVILSDHQCVEDFASAAFALAWHSSWHPALLAKRYVGNYYHEAFADKPKAWATSGHAEFDRYQWHQLVFTWDWEANQCRIFINGVLAGHSDAYVKHPLQVDKAGPRLYAGDPSMAISDVACFDKVFDEEMAAEWFRQENTPENPDDHERLQSTYKALPTVALDHECDTTWRKRLELSLNSDSGLDAFYVQGCHSAPSVTGEGLEVRTLQEEPKHTFTGARDHGHAYLWTKEMFEGDLYVKYDFKIHHHGGLAILMTNCSGMHGQDFFDDRILPTSGIMKTVCWEDIRNYHWEYYREMNDVRNDCISQAVLKNPWFCPVGFKAYPGKWNLDEWYRLEYLQVDGQIRCAINGQVVVDGSDSPSTNNGPILNGGRIALRLMRRSAMTFRNFEVWDRPHVLPV